MTIANTPLAIQINPQQLGLELGTGAVIGDITGFAAKKLAKVIAVIIGVELALFKLLESRGVIDVHWSMIGATFLDAGEITASGRPPSWVMSVLSTVSMGSNLRGDFFCGSNAGDMMAISSQMLAFLFGVLRRAANITVAAVQRACSGASSLDTVPRIGTHTLRVLRTEVNSSNRH